MSAEDIYLLNDNDFLMVPISSFFFEHPPPFDIFVRLNDKAVLYHKKQALIDVERFKRLKEKNVEKLFIRRSDTDIYYQFIRHQITELYSGLSLLNGLEQAQLILNSTVSLLEIFHHDPSRTEYITYFKVALEKVRSFMKKEKKALNLFLLHKNSSHCPFHHEFNTLILALSAMLSDPSLSPSENEIEALGLACLLHDHFQVAPDYHLNLDKMQNPVYFNNHPKEIFKITENLDQLPFRSKKLILQHLERADGSGQPSQTKKGMLDPLVYWLTLAFEFDRLFSFENQDAKSAIKRLFIVETGRSPFENLKVFKECLKKNNVI